MADNPKVFLSHGHQDRSFTTKIQKTLEKNGAETYLDQDQIQAGDVLPDRIHEGILWCNTFLLIWSGSSSLSKWVAIEWNAAYDFRKKIIPYSLDQTPLPEALQNLVYIDSNDRQHGNASLLKTVFGKGFIPIDPTTLFPGKWHATADAYGLASGTYNLTLRANGQVEGEGGMGQGGISGLVESMGLGGLMNMQFPISGTWSYNQGEKVLNMTLTTSGFGQVNTDVLRIHASGKERGAIQGQDLEGRTWTLQRIS